MSDNQKNSSIQLIELSGFKAEFIETMDDSRERMWFWMYLSGGSVDQIAAEFNCQRSQVFVSLQRTIKRYNREVKQKKDEQNNHPSKKERTLPKDKKQLEQGKSAHKDVEKKYRPKTQNKRVYQKLNKRIDSQFDKKFFIGDIRVTDEDYQELLEYTRFQIKDVTTNTTPLSDSPVLAVALVQMGIRCYDGNYWGNALKNELHVSNIQAYQKFLGDSFIQTLKKHGKHILNESEKVQTILFHSFVTNYYSKGLFELLFQYYSKDLERDIYRNDKAQMQALMETLRMNADLDEEASDAFTGQFTGRGSRAYKLRHHTLQAISANPTHSSMRLRHILRLMDKAFWKDSVPQKPVSRLTILFKEWLQESPSFNNEYRLYKSGVIRNRGKKHFSSPYLFADIKNSSFCIVLPPQIIRQEFSAGLFWKVRIGSKTVVEATETYPVLTGYKTEEVRVPLSVDNLFSRVSCVLCQGTDVVRCFADITESPFRLFDIEGDYSTRVFKIPMCAYTENNYAFKSQALIDKVFLGKVTRWDFEFVNGDILILPDGKSMVVGERYSDGLTPRGTVEGAAYYENDESPITVYNRIPELLLTLPKNKVPGTVIDVNGTRYRLNECENDEFDALDSRGARAFLIPLCQFHECKEYALNQVILDVPGSQYARQYAFVYIPGLSISFEGAPYVFEERGVLVFPEGIKARCVSRNADSLHEENGFQFILSGEMNTIVARLNDSIDITFSVPLFRWSYDGENWNIEPMGDIWHTDFRVHRQLYFHAPDNRLEFGMDEDYDDGEDETEQRIQPCEKRGDGSYILDLTRFRSWIGRDRVVYKIMMRLGRKEYEFASVYARSFVVSCDLSADYDTGLLTCSADIIGKSDYYVDITHLSSGVKIVEKGLMEKCMYSVADRLRNGEYKVEFFEAEEDDDFFGETTYYLIHAFTKSLVNKNDLSGNHIRLLSFRPAIHSLIHTRLSRAIWIKNIEKTGPLTYEGQIIDSELGDLRVQVEFESSRDFRYFRLSYWDEYDESFFDFIFDTYTKNLVLEEAPGLRPSVRYRRYCLLFDSDYVFYGSLESHIE